MDFHENVVLGILKNNDFCKVKFLLQFLFVGFIPFWCQFAWSQKQLAASKIDESIILDGKLTEACWNTAEKATDFTVNFPQVGVQSDFKSVVRFVYDDQAIYIAAELYDLKPDSVLSMLSQRDDFGNADWFGVLIDPYGSGQNGFGFYTTAAGVEIDAVLGQASTDLTWNAVWKSKAILTDFGWSVEMRIPLSQLRFPKVDVQNWNINFKRQVRRKRESSYWNEVNPQEFGEITQSGKLTNLVNLNSPLRLSFSPYTTAYVENFYDDQSGKQDWRYRQRFGMDVKLGLSESFTLDATLIPDFGQTVSDRLVLNLSPFEVRYNENRPFFLEGMDLFGIGDVFYSRRIGSNTYQGDAKVDSLQAAGREVVTAPGLAQLVNATKISGRTKKGLGIGFFNAIEKASYVVYKDSLGNLRETLAHPFSNYNVLVFSQNMKNNGNFSLINTNVLRPEVDLLANVTNAEFTLFTKNRTYSLTGQGQFSTNQKSGSIVNGHSDYLSFSKVQGIITYNVDYYECSDTYDPNEIGFLARNNYRGTSAQIKWIGYERKGNFLRRTAILNTNAEFLYAPSKFAYWTINGNVNATFKNFLTAGIDLNVWPVKEIDFFESRTFGVPLVYPQSFQVGGFYSSDYSKKYALDFSLYNRYFAGGGMNNIDFSVSPRIRFSNKLFLVLGSDVSRYIGNYGYVRVSDTLYTDQIMIGYRNRWIVNNSIAADYTFTNRMGMMMTLNHYWQEVNYQKFGVLNNEGYTSIVSYTGLDSLGNSKHNTSFNAFTIDLSFRWVIYPGSEIRFLWKYNIYSAKQGLDLNYFRTFNDLFSQPQLNSFSIKALFFLDAAKWKRKKKV